MYSGNPLTSFPSITMANYLSSSMGNSTGVIGGEKLNGQYYFSWSQSIKMALEGHYKFNYLTEEVTRPLRENLERGGLSSSVCVD